MAIVDTQRPALEAVAPSNAKEFWPPTGVFQDKTVFFVEENGTRAQIYFSGVNHGDGIYATRKGVLIAGFLAQDAGNDSRALTGVDVLCGVLLRPVRIGKRRVVEVVRLKFKEFWHVDKKDEPGPILELLFEATNHRTTYIPL